MSNDYRNSQYCPKLDSITSKKKDLQKKIETMVSKKYKSRLGYAGFPYTSKLPFSGSSQIWAGKSKFKTAFSLCSTRSSALLRAEETR